MSRISVQGRSLMLAAAVLAAAGVMPNSSGAAAGGSGPYVERARATHPTFFQRGQYGAGYRFTLGHPKGEPVHAKVRLYRGRPEAGRLLHTWDLGRVQPGVRQTVNWHGALPGGWAMQGPYTLEVRARDAAGRRLDTASREKSRERIRFYRHAFPVRGRHDFGSHAAAFGAQRGGRSHQGHDVFARRGRTVVAARRGRVVFNERGRAAGNYVVIRGDDGYDYAYMHLRRPSPREVGEMVRTGERIGRVGCSGSCSGPHLHFEMWTRHWWDGGEPLDPFPFLRRWDRWS